MPKFHELAMECKRQHEEYVANQCEAAKLIAAAFDGDIRDERMRFGSAINAAGHVNLSGNGTVRIEKRNLPVELAVQIRELLKEAGNLCAG